MKKFLLVFLIVLLCPFFVFADTCNQNDIVIESIEKKEWKNTTELTKATIKDNKILLDLQMSSIKDSITYEVLIHNKSSYPYEVNKNTINLQSDYLDYSIDSEDYSNTIKGNAKKKYYITVTYQNRVEDSKYQEGIFQDKKEFVLRLSNNTNPKTGTNILLTIFILLFISTSFVFVKEKQKVMVLLIGCSLLLPLGVFAICQTDIIIDSNVIIKKKNYNPCTFIGDITPGVEYQNGKYIYRYKEEMLYGEGINWNPMNLEGWGVYYDETIEADSSITMCSSINEIPIVSTQSMFLNPRFDGTKTDLTNFDFETLFMDNVVHAQAMFFGTKAKDVDLRNLNFKNVTDMVYLFEGLEADSIDISGMEFPKVKDLSLLFGGVKAKTINVENLRIPQAETIGHMFSSIKVDTLKLSGMDTSNVVNMGSLFAYSEIKNGIDLTNFDTSNVIRMSDMFTRIETEKLDLSMIDTSKVVYMDYMFSRSKIDELILDGFNTSNVTTMKYMFDCFETTKPLNLSSFNTSNVTDMSRMFGSSKIPSLDVSSFNTSNVTNMSGMFSAIEQNTLDLRNFDTSNVTSMRSMFIESKFNNLYLTSFNTSRVTDMLEMFYKVSGLTTLDLSSFDMSNVTNRSYMLKEISATVGYARTEADANKLNQAGVTQIPDTLRFVVKP